MSKTKRSLPEDFSVLQGDELDGSPDITDEPSATDHAVNDLTNAIRVLDEDRTSNYAYSKELKELSVKLANIAEFADVPF